MDNPWQKASNDDMAELDDFVNSWKFLDREDPPFEPKPYNHEAEIRGWPTTPDRRMESAEYVPIEHVYPLREFDRQPGGKDFIGDPQMWNALKDHIKEHGIQNPLQLDYHPDSNTAKLGEGNHRLMAAKELGMTHVPVIGWRRTSPQKHQSPHSPDTSDLDLDVWKNPYWPPEIKPHNMGLPVRERNDQYVGSVGLSHRIANMPWVQERWPTKYFYEEGDPSNPNPPSDLRDTWWHVSDKPTLDLSPDHEHLQDVASAGRGALYVSHDPEQWTRILHRGRKETYLHRLYCPEPLVKSLGNGQFAIPPSSFHLTTIIGTWPMSVAQKYQTDYDSMSDEEYDTRENPDEWRWLPKEQRDFLNQEQESRLSALKESTYQDNVWYHGSSPRNRDSIQSQGLQPGIGGFDETESDEWNEQHRFGVYLTESVEDALRWGEDVWQVKLTPEMELKLFDDAFDDIGVIYPGEISAENLSVVVLDGQSKIAMPYANNIWYHVTHRDNLQSVRDHGLTPVNRGMGNDKNWEEYSVVTGGIYLSPNISSAEGFRLPTSPLMQQTGWQGSDAVILRVEGIDQRRLHPDPEELSRVLEDIHDGYNETDVLGLLTIVDQVTEIGMTGFDNAGSNVWSAYTKLGESDKQEVKQWYEQTQPTSSWVYLGTIPAQAISQAEHPEEAWDDNSGRQELLEQSGYGLDDESDDFANQYKYKPMFAKKAMADRTGVPEIDALIVEYLKTPMGDWTTDDSFNEALKDPAKSAGMCHAVSEDFAAFAKARGYDVTVTMTDLDEMGYTPTGDPAGEIMDEHGEIVPGFYEDHTINEVYRLPDGTKFNFPIAIDWTASQYGYKDHPKISSDVKTSNILDEVRDELCAQVFDRPADIDPDVKPEIVEWVKTRVYDAMIQAGWPDPSQEKYMGLVLTGSLCTYQYSEGPEGASDFDTSVFIDAERFPEWVRSDLISALCHTLNGETVPGTNHPLEIYVVPQDVSRDDLYQVGVRSAYDLDARKWIVLPDKNMSVDVRLRMPELVTYARMQVDKLSNLLKYNPRAGALHFLRIQQNRRESMARGEGNLTPINVAWKWIENEGLYDAGKKAVKQFDLVKAVTAMAQLAPEKQQELQAHIAELVSQYKITVKEDPTLDENSGFAWRGPDTIHIPPVTTDVAYITALHEVAHIIFAGHTPQFSPPDEHGEQHRDPTKEFMYGEQGSETEAQSDYEEEAWVWNWVKANTKTLLTPEIVAGVTEALETYHKGMLSQRDIGVEPKYGPASQQFTQEWRTATSSGQDTGFKYGWTEGYPGHNSEEFKAVLRQHGLPEDIAETNVLTPTQKHIMAADRLETYVQNEDGRWQVNYRSKPQPQLQSVRLNPRDQMDSLYDPQFVSIKPHEMAAEFESYKDRKDWELKPLPEGYFTDRDIKNQDLIDPGHIWRGMSSEEYEEMMTKGELRSQGLHNIGDAQAGLSFFADERNPATAFSYAHGFAPAAHKATFDKPAYVIKARMPEWAHTPSDGSHIPSGEVAVSHLPISYITDVYKGTPVLDQPSHFAITEYYGRYDSGGAAPGSTPLVWSKIENPPRDKWSRLKVSWNIPNDANEWDYWTAHDEELPEKLYHVAPSKFRENILEEGLYPKETWNTGADSHWNPEDEQNYTVSDDGEEFAYEWRPSAIYLWQQLEDAQRYAQPKDDIWEIDSSELYDVRKDPASAMNWKYLDSSQQTLMVEDVPAHAVRLLTPDTRESSWTKTAWQGTNLQGLNTQVNIPNVGPIEVGGHAELQGLANSYNQRNGFGEHPTDYLPVNPETSAQIAQAYEEMEHRPNDPEVKAAYDALKSETLDQYQDLVNAGYVFEFYPEQNPYPNSPREAVLDLHNNKHMYVYPTLDGGGFGTETQVDEHPLLGDSGIRWDGKMVTYNDLFRAVHDVYGHAKEGVGFRADGEDNAYRQHAAMFSPLALKALTSETRGQNSWVNYGVHGEHNQTAGEEDTIFADQKAGIMPDWVMDPDLHRNS